MESAAGSDEFESDASLKGRRRAVCVVRDVVEMDFGNLELSGLQCGEVLQSGSPVANPRRAVDLALRRKFISNNTKKRRGANPLRIDRNRRGCVQRCRKRGFDFGCCGWRFQQRGRPAIENFSDLSVILLRDKIIQARPDFA